MNDADRKELMDLIAEYGTAAIVEGSAGRIRQFKRIVKHVEAMEAAAIEQCAELIDGMNDSAGDRASYDNREMHDGEVERMNALSDAANAIRALLPKEES